MTQPKAEIMAPSVVDEASIAFQVSIDEPVCCLAQVLAIGMAADADHRVDLIARSVQTVEPFEPRDHTLVGVHRKDRVLIAISE